MKIYNPDFVKSFFIGKNIMKTFDFLKICIQKKSLAFVNSYLSCVKKKSVDQLTNYT